ncbi:DUF397 domain-containing protein [Micromonospora zhanjiangensis]|uniref:DUF397 domain-containing protein n=1 Tax=Micromonospora zhanjiangensis TaxID=1522057 RepID=A0ABV8KT20_9ACTN
MNAPDLGPVEWRRSTRSGANGNCVEVAQLDDVVALRDSKNAGGPVLLITASTWRAFLQALGGRIDVD